MNVRRLIGVIYLFHVSEFSVGRGVDDEPTGYDRAHFIDRSGGNDHENVHDEKENKDSAMNQWVARTSEGVR
jgi:hypothetical protein